MPKVICKKIGCNKLIDKGINSGYCDEHKEAGVKLKQEADRYRMKQYNQGRNPKYVRFYNGIKWKQLREYILTRDNYLCQDCYSRNVITYAKDIHHIEDIKESWDKRYDENNLISLCHDCHNKRHNRF